MTSAVINIHYNLQSDSIRQIITINPDKKRHLKYFLNNKYEAGKRLEDELRKYYIGDGESILFDKENQYDNIKIIDYKIIKSAEHHFTPIEFSIFATLPSGEGCLACRYYRPRYRRCLYYKKMHITIKQKCVAFEQGK